MFTNFSSDVQGMVTALKESSLHHLAKRLLLCSTPMQVDPMDDLCYDSLWRLSDWSQIMSLKTSQSSSKENDFSKSHYEALQCLHENDNGSLQKSLEEAYFCVIKDLCNISLGKYTTKLLRAKIRKQIFNYFQLLL